MNSLFCKMKSNSVILCVLFTTALICTCVSAQVQKAEVWDSNMDSQSQETWENELIFSVDEDGESDDDVTTSFPDEGYNCTENGAFPHPQYCEYYYDCYNGIDTLFKCQLNYLFDLVYSGCNFPGLTHCGDRERPEGYPNTDAPPLSTTTPGSGPGYQCPPENGHYPDMDDCTSYWQCYEGTAYHFTCPFPLRFDIDLQVCNFPGSVICGDRPLP